MGNLWDEKHVVMKYTEQSMEQISGMKKKEKNCFLKGKFIFCED